MRNTINTNGASGVDPSLIDLQWDALPPAVNEALTQPLDPALVSQRKGRGGRSFRYLEGHTAIDQANQVFGYGGWGYELVGDVTLRQNESADSRTGEVTRVAAYSAVVRVNVTGAPPRTDVGFHPVTDDSPEGHETAFKGAVTDALKRALRSFGDRFGNGLYGDAPAPQQRGQNRTAPPAATRQPAPDVQVSGPDDEADARILRAQLLELSVQQGFTEQQVRAAVRHKTSKELDQLGPSELNPLIASATEKLQRKQESSAA